MKVSRQQASENREAIVQVAAAQLRERGFTQMSVADVAEAASLTHGALYSHFKSKDALQAAALARAFEDCIADFASLPIEQFLGRYFSETHRDDPSHGCPTAALMSEMPCQTEEARVAFHEGFGRFADMLRSTLQSGHANKDRDFSMLAVAAMTGTLAISRALKGVDHAAADAILHAVEGQLREALTVCAGQSFPPKRRRHKPRGNAAPAGPPSVQRK